MDGLARDPNKFITPHNADTGETILHLLAKEGKVEILQNLLDDNRVEKELTGEIKQIAKYCQISILLNHLLLPEGQQNRDFQ